MNIVEIQLASVADLWKVSQEEELHVLLEQAAEPTEQDPHPLDRYTMVATIEGDTVLLYTFFAAPGERPETVKFLEGGGTLVFAGQIHMYDSKG